jgi:hypothetical protein
MGQEGAFLAIRKIVNKRGKVVWPCLNFRGKLEKEALKFTS